YAAGHFLDTGGVRYLFIARWDGSAWTPLSGGGVSGGPEPGGTQIHTLAVFDDGSGPALYVGGNFTRAGGVPANRIDRWDGSAWTPRGEGVSSSSGMSVGTVSVFDDGTGPALYAGGSFLTAGGATVRGIARWDGAAWTPLGDWIGGVRALTVFDDGTGPALYAGGSFFAASGAIGNGMARWDGASWTPLGDGVRDGDS